MVYSRRSAPQAQANNTTPAYSTMATRNNPQAGQFAAQQQYGNNVSAPATNYQQSYNTSGYTGAQTFTPSPAKTAAAAAQPPAQPAQQPPVKAEDSAAMDTTEDGKEGKPRRWSGGVKYKVNKRLKRAKRNDNLRRVIKPKNSIMCLHELITGLQFNIQELPTGHDGLLKYCVSVCAYGKTYEGTGVSKLQAKQVACENALKGILIDRMVKQAQKEAQGNDQPMSDENGDNVDSRVEDNIPWVNVASFALHKLFSEWQAQGTNIPIDGLVPNAGVHPARAAKPGKPSVVKPLPENPTHYQPTMLLHMVRPGITYTDTTIAETPPEFKATCIVDGKTYTGVASKKKMARKNAAKAALADMGVVYPPEA